ncbi:hypothetical protein OAS39_04610 [Pirellulales bacterium]|nr:hypothetical protein [Pirellulales bacterium]
MMQTKLFSALDPTCFAQAGAVQLGRIAPAITSIKRIIPLLCLSAFLCEGCSKGGLPAKVVYGTVTVGEEQVELGQIAFVPIDDTKGPTSAGTITGGSYRVDARGGVPLGTFRVEVVAQRTTGRQVQGGREGGELVDEIVTMGPPVYATENSPLKLELTADSDGEYNVELPVQ